MKPGPPGRRSGAPVARQVRRDHAHRRGHEGDQHGEQEGVERLHAEGPEDEPEDEAERARDDDAHGAGNASGTGRRVAATPHRGGRCDACPRPTWRPPRWPRRYARRGAAIAATPSRTAAAGSPDSPAARTSREPTITPSAPASA